MVYTTNKCIKTISIPINHRINVLFQYTISILDIIYIHTYIYLYICHVSYTRQKPLSIHFKDVVPWYITNQSHIPIIPSPARLPGSVPTPRRFHWSFRPSSCAEPCAPRHRRRVRRGARRWRGCRDSCGRPGNGGTSKGRRCCLGWEKAGNGW